MSKIGIVLSILCMPLVSFGMDRDRFNHVDALNELHPYFSHTEFLSALPQQETQSISYNAVLQPMQQFAIAPYERVAQDMDLALDDYALQELAHAYSLSSALLLEMVPQQSYPEARYETLNGQADNEDMEPSVIYSDSTLKRIQARHAKNNKQCPIDKCSKLSTYTVDHAAAMHHICLLCDPLYYADRARIKEHFKQMHPTQLFSHKIKKEACKECGTVITSANLKRHAAICKGIKNIEYTLAELKELKRIYKKKPKRCPIEICSKDSKRSTYTVDHVAAMHKICLLCKPPLYCDDKKDMKQHFKEKHPSADYVTRDKKIACEQCGKKITKASMQAHLRAACKRMRSAASAATSDKN